MKKNNLQPAAAALGAGVAMALAGVADAAGKLGTGKKGPAVCGTFSGASCAVQHLAK